MNKIVLFFKKKSLSIINIGNSIERFFKKKKKITMCRKEVLLERLINCLRELKLLKRTKIV